MRFFENGYCLGQFVTVSYWGPMARGPWKRLGKQIPADEFALLTCHMGGGLASFSAKTRLFTPDIRFATGRSSRLMNHFVNDMKGNYDWS